MKLGSEFLFGKTSGFITAFANHHRHSEPARHEQWLVAKFLRRSVWIHERDSACLAAVSARQNVEFDRARRQQFAERQDKRRFSGTTHRKVADTDHRSLESLRPEYATIIKRVLNSNTDSEDGCKRVHCGRKLPPGTGFNRVLSASNVL